MQALKPIWERWKWGVRKERNKEKNGKEEIKKQDGKKKTLKIMMIKIFRDLS